MRSILIFAMFTASLANAASGDEYQEVRDLNLDASGISTLEIEAGAGSLEVIGVSGANEIVVTATIQVPEGDEDKARKEIKSLLVLSLEKAGDRAVLTGYFKSGFMNFGDSPHVQLEVRVPEGLNLKIDDGSGSIVLENVAGNIEVADGSGSISMTNVGGNVEIDDGSGSISVEGVRGDLVIGDGSGSIKVREVAGSVTVDDGSGSINVSDVEQDLIIEEDGSGSLDFSNIGGRVEKES
jgi:hypothetical protein